VTQAEPQTIVPSVIGGIVLAGWSFPKIAQACLLFLGAVAAIALVLAYYRGKALRDAGITDIDRMDGSRTGPRRRSRISRRPPGSTGVTTRPCSTRASCICRPGQRERGEEILKEYNWNRVAARPDDAQAHREFGGYYLRSGSSARAIVQFKRVLELKPNDGRGAAAPRAGAHQRRTDRRGQDARSQRPGSGAGERLSLSPASRDHRGGAPGRAASFRKGSIR
jgi:hypothetical protein